MGRELRMVPANWEHPKDGRGHHIPLHGDGISKAIEEWEEGRRQWGLGLCSDFKGGWEPKTKGEKEMTWEEYTGECPTQYDYFPDWKDSECTHLQMYETCTEGTPISPVMETPEKLARWLADNNASAFGSQGATYEQWLGTCKSGWAPSAIYTPKTGLVSGVAGTADLKKTQ